MKNDTFLEFFLKRYKNQNSFRLPNIFIRNINLNELLKEDIEDYNKYLSSLERVRIIPKYSLL